MSIVTMDKYGRIRIPKEYLKDIKTNRFIIKKSDNLIILLPIEEKDLSQYIDSVEIDVKPEVFRDYKELKKALLGVKHEIY